MQYYANNGGKNMENRCEIEILLDNLKKRLNLCNAELERLPEGRLHQIHRDNQLTFFQAVSNSESRQIRKVITHQPEVIMQLARKEYLKEERKILEKDIHILQQLLERYSDPGAKTVLLALPQRFHKLPEEWFFYQSQETRLADELTEWASAPYRQSTYKPEKKNKRTSRGLMVRSMGEVACTEQFYYHDIAFRYEQVLIIEGIEFAPDFTIKRRRDGKIFYWEHCGKPYDEGYMRHHKWKLEMYEKVGIVPWDNLIVTYSDQNNNSDVKLIQSEIINKLL